MTLKDIQTSSKVQFGMKSRRSSEMEWNGMKRIWQGMHSRKHQQKTKFCQYVFVRDQVFQPMPLPSTADAIGQGAASDLLFEARDGLPRPTQIQIH